MQKIKESFHEVIAGQPVKQHYVYVSIVTVSLSVVVGLFMVYFKIGHWALTVISHPGFCVLAVNYKISCEDADIGGCCGCL